MHLSKPLGCTTPKVNPKINYGFCVTDTSMEVHFDRREAEHMWNHGQIKSLPNFAVN